MQSRRSKTVILSLLCVQWTLLFATPAQATSFSKDHTLPEITYFASSPRPVPYTQFLGAIRSVYGKKSAARVNALHDEIQRRPEKNIPELAFLKTHDWAQIAGEKSSGRSAQKRLENTLEKLTIRAKRNFLEALSDELRSRPGVRLKSITRTEQLRPFLKDWLISPNLYELNHYEVVPLPKKPKTTSPDQENSFVPDLVLSSFVPDLMLRTRRTRENNSSNAQVAISHHRSQVSSTFEPGE